MAILSKGMELSHSTTSAGTFTALTGLKSVPSLGGTKEQVDVTTLADSSYKYIAGLTSYENLTFSFIYDKTVYSTLSGLSGVQYWKVTFPDGVYFTFSGECSVAVDGGEVNAAVTMTLTIVLNSDIEFHAGSTPVGPTGSQGV